MSDDVADVIAIGGGPAGSAVARLLSAWGHSVLVIARDDDPERGLAESLPPSGRKLLAAIGALAEVERAGFCRGVGSAVWWGDREGALEPDASADAAGGFQVFRPELDALLLRLAREAGARVADGATVQGVTLADPRAAAAPLARVHYVRDGAHHVARARFVLDCSGRAGVIGRRFRRHERAFRMQALVGVWDRPDGWGLDDDSYTMVETCDDGWAWSIPVAPGTRHLVAMVDGSGSDGRRSRTLTDLYMRVLSRARQMDGLRQGATLRRVWARDASLYSARACAGASWLLIGDAGSAIDPLSSFGVKKALASAFVGAVAVHTALLDAGRASAALAFFDQREREMYAAHLRQSRDYAREAHVWHPHPFWSARANVEVAPLGRAQHDAVLLASPDVQEAFAALRRDETSRLVAAGAPGEASVAVIERREVVIAPALRIDGVSHPVRHVAGVDVVRVRDLARVPGDVPELFERYESAVARVPLPAFLQGVSLLVARGLLARQPLAGK